MAKGDAEQEVCWLVDKILNLRVFEDDNGKMNLSLCDTSGELMVVSQFTLVADLRKGRRPSFEEAASPDDAKRLYELFVRLAREKGVEVKAGVFGETMVVELQNDGPVTLILEAPLQEILE